MKPDPSPSPSPDATPTPSPSRRAAGRGSSTGSAAGSADFIADAGPTFEPPDDDTPPDVAPLPEEEPAPLAAWEEAQVRDLLVVQGRATHAVVGVAEQDWVHTDADLKAIAPPLTRILNRYPATAAAAALGDEALLIAGVSGYAMRSYIERKQELARRAAQPDEPVTGAAPDPGTPGPETPDAPSSVGPTFNPVVI